MVLTPFNKTNQWMICVFFANVANKTIALKCYRWSQHQIASHHMNQMGPKNDFEKVRFPQLIFFHIFTGISNS